MTRDSQSRSGGRFLVASLMFVGIWLPQCTVLANEPGNHDMTEGPYSGKSWQGRLSDQVADEYAAEGRADHRDRVDAAMKRLTEAIGSGGREHTERKAEGGFSHVSMMQQMDRSFFLGPSGQEERVKKGGRCPSHASKKRFDVSAIYVEIPINQWLDFHPGYMYVLTENIASVRREEEVNRKAREKEGQFDPGSASTGLQTDMIQPLAIRANQGDCVEVLLRNALDGEDVGLHIHGSSQIIQSSGEPATAANPASTVQPGGTQTFEWYIRPSEQEGTHMFHSHVGRDQSSLGMIGALIVEPTGSTYLNPLSGEPLGSGWQAMIANPGTPDFREFVIFYHETGDESFRVLNRSGETVPHRDPKTDAYRPGTRGLNFRSEPFGVNNLALQEKYFHFEDESLSYSAYTFGDPPTPIPRSYVGDPAKFRLVHGGGEMFHSHHPHGGAIRWLRQPKADTKAGEILTAAQDGPVKYPLIRTTSDRVDAQVIGPSETLDLETECGSGLCQSLAGDFLFHCHVAHHYVAGMWSYWRVYNTLQTGNYPFESTDTMPPLQELPDRMGRMRPAVRSDQLLDRTMDWYDKKWHITADRSDWSKPVPDVSVGDWVKMMLPPAGQPGHTSDEEGQILAFDATVWDWTWEGSVAMGEPEASGKFPWPKYRSPMPGKRLPILFDRKTGKLAWPHFKPHFGKRVPFARHHGPAPWLEPIHMDKDNGTLPSDPGGKGAPGQETNQPARPGEQGRWSLCPENAGRKQYNVHFIETPIQMTRGLGNRKPVVDPNGLLYVLKEDEREVRGNPASDKTIPLVYRANVYDCVDVVLTSEWVDNDTTNFQMSKVNIHPHFIQFDNQASDGVITGFSYEQSVRPFTQMTKAKKSAYVQERDGVRTTREVPKGLPVPMNATLAEDAKAGAMSIRIFMAEGATRFHAGTDLMIGVDEVATTEVLWIKAIQGDSITFTEPLRFDHKQGEIASVEFVRYRYWVDADVGTVFWHDHAMGISTWPHGAVGAMIVEPVGATYHDPTTGAPIRSGPVADIHSTEPIGFGVSGSFRELVVMLQDTVATTPQIVADGNPPGQTRQVAIDAGTQLTFRMPEDVDWTAVRRLNGGTHTTGGGLNMRAESVARRLTVNPDATRVFASRTHGDPSTPLLRAYVGDPLVFRVLHTMMNETHTWHLAGHMFRPERYAEYSARRNTQRVGIAERYDLVTRAGGAQQMAGDYLHYNGRVSHFSEGSWGIVRVLDHAKIDLKPLPGREEIAQASTVVCPADAPVKTFDVAAVDYSLKYNPKADDVIEVDFERRIQVANPAGKVFVLEADLRKASLRSSQPMPLTLHVNVGDCIQINLRNRLSSGRVSFSADALAFDPRNSHGINVGMNPGDQTTPPGRRRTFTFYAHPQNGETAALVWDWGDFVNNVRDGLFGAVIVGPRGSKYRDPITGEDVSLKSAWQVDVVVDRSLPENRGRADYRDASLFFQDEDNIIGTLFMPYIQQIAGLVGVNYRVEPWGYREENGCNVSNMYSRCTRDSSQPITPTIVAHAGDPVRIHVFGAFSEQNQVFSLEGHEWPLEPSMSGADMMSSLQFGGTENLDVYIKDGAGGPFHLPGTYVWQNHRMPHLQAGQWGWLRVLPTGSREILPLKPAQ